MGQTVNLLRLASVVRIHHYPQAKRFELRFKSLFLLPFFNQFKREVSGAHRAVLESPCVVFKPTGLPFLRGRIAFGSPSLPFRLAKGLPLRAKRAAFTS